MDKEAYEVRRECQRSREEQSVLTSKNDKMAAVAQRGSFGFSKNDSIF